MQIGQQFQQDGRDDQVEDGAEVDARGRVALVLVAARADLRVAGPQTPVGQLVTVGGNDGAAVPRDVSGGRLVKVVVDGNLDAAFALAHRANSGAVGEGDVGHVETVEEWPVAGASSAEPRHDVAPVAVPGHLVAVVGIFVELPHDDPRRLVQLGYLDLKSEAVSDDLEEDESSDLCRRHLVRVVENDVGFYLTKNVCELMIFAGSRWLLYANCFNLINNSCSFKINI